MGKIAIFVVFLFAFISSIYSQIIPVCDSKIYCSGRIIEAVNYWKLPLITSPDSKNFTDMPLLKSPEETLKDFDKSFPNNMPAKKMNKETLLKFVQDHFGAPGTELDECSSSDLGWSADPKKIAQISDSNYRDWAKSLNEIWKKLCRKVNIKVQRNQSHYSLIYVPKPFIVPGGRFREFYYWDSYWTIRGLLVSGMYKMSENMIRNMANLVERYGFVPNGGRIYYLMRSQPPFLIPMLYEHYMATGDQKLVHELLPTLLKEYQFWERNRTVQVTLKGKKYSVFQYRTPSNVPRPESYKEDVAHAEEFSDEARKRQFYHDVASTAESGMDFSSRWFADKQNLTTVKTTKIVPVDLNAILCWNLDILKLLYKIEGDDAMADKMQEKREVLKEALADVFYNDETGAWFDYDLEKKAQNVDFYPSVAVPLFTGCYQAINRFKPEKLYKYMKDIGVLDHPGGVPTSLHDTKQQWDFPNGWPSLTHMIIEGFRKSRDSQMQEMGYKIAEKWIKGNYLVWKQYGHMYEKYDVEKEIPKPGTGGEYVVQTGFGWTNGVVLDLLYAYKDRLTTSTSTSGSYNIFPNFVTLITFAIAALFYECQ